MKTKLATPETGSGNEIQSLEAAIERIRKLHGKEIKLQGHVKRMEREATLVAFRIGAIILEQVEARGRAARQQIADHCGFTEMTAYNYEYLFRGAITDEVLDHHHDLSREYFQWIGRSIMKKNDALSLMVRHNLLAYPLWIETKTGEKKPNADMIVQVGSLLDDTRAEIVALGVEYVFENATNDLVDNDLAYDFVCKSADQKNFIKAMASVRDLFIHISALANWGNRVGINLDALTGEDAEAIAPDESGVLVGDTVDTIKIKRRRAKAVAKNISQSDVKKLTSDNRIIHGRSEVVLQNSREFPVHSVDVVITDPPYSDEYYPQDSKSDHTIVRHDAEKTLAGQAELVGRIARILVEHKIIKPQFVWFTFVPIDYVHVFLPPLLNAFDGADFIHQVLVWDKKQGQRVGGHRTFARQAEAILYVNVGNKPMNYSRKGEERKLLHPNIIVCQTEKVGGVSANWKPVELLEQLILFATHERNKANQVVLDPFAGSGSTGVAAINLGRDFRLIESNENQLSICRRTIASALKLR